MSKNNVAYCGFIATLRLILLFTLLLGLSSATILAPPVAFAVPPCTDNETTITFQGVSQNVSAGTYTWKWQLCQQGNALSHWVLAICQGIVPNIVDVGYINSSNIAFSIPPCSDSSPGPCWVFGLDPTTGTLGLKWDNMTGPSNGDCWTLYLTLNANLAQGDINWASKYATCVDKGTTTGPLCPSNCSPPPNCTITCDPPSCTICQGSSITLSAPAGNYTYSWSPGGSTSQNITVSPAATTTYFVTVTDSDTQCYSTCNRTVTVSPCPPAQSLIVVFKYYDKNHNGVFDGQDYPLSGWTICLNGSTCNMTDGTGIATFSNLSPGVYTICETLPAGWKNSEPGTNPPCYQNVNLGSDAQLTFNFGNYQPGPVGGTVGSVDTVNLLQPWLSLLGIMLVLGTLLGTVLIVRKRA